jgi:hypothetical protein
MIAYCSYYDSDEYVLNLLRSEMRYIKICPEGIKQDVQKKIYWLRKECERRNIKED